MADRTLAIVRRAMNWHAPAPTIFAHPLCVGWPGPNPRNGPANASSPTKSFVHFGPLHPRQASSATTSASCC